MVMILHADEQETKNIVARFIVNGYGPAEDVK
jgi:hypothetical protein